MRLRSLALALIISASSSSSPVLSMDDGHDVIGERESRKSRGSLRYLNEKREKASLASESDSDLSVPPGRKDSSLTGYDADTESHSKTKKSPSTSEPLTLKVNTVLPKMFATKGRTLTMLGDPLETTITLADGKPYKCGSKEAEIDISDFEPEGNRHFARFDVRIKDRTRHVVPDAKALLYKNHGNQTLSRCRFVLSAKVTEPTVDITYDKDSRRFSVSGLWPSNRRVN